MYSSVIAVTSRVAQGASPSAIPKSVESLVREYATVEHEDVSVSPSQWPISKVMGSLCQAKHHLGEARSRRLAIG